MTLKKKLEATKYTPLANTDSISEYNDSPTAVRPGSCWCSGYIIRSGGVEYRSIGRKVVCGGQKFPSFNGSLPRASKSFVNSRQPSAGVRGQVGKPCTCDDR